MWNYFIKWNHIVKDILFSRVNCKILKRNFRLRIIFFIKCALWSWQYRRVSYKTFVGFFKCWRLLQWRSKRVILIAPILKYRQRSIARRPVHEYVCQLTLSFVFEGKVSCRNIQNNNLYGIQSFLVCNPSERWNAWRYVRECQRNVTVSWMGSIIQKITTSALKEKSHGPLLLSWINYNPSKKCQDYVYVKWAYQSTI